MHNRWLLLIMGVCWTSVADAGRMKKGSTQVGKPISFQAVSLTETAENEPPTVTLRVLPAGVVGAQGPDQTVQVERISGCHGDPVAAREHVVDAAGLVAQPEYRVDQFQPGLFGVKDDAAAVCALDDQPTGLVNFSQSVMGFESYLSSEIYDCGCGDCFDPETMSPIEGDLLSNVIPEHREQYASYRVDRIKEVEQQRAVHAAYANNHSEWTAQRADVLSGSFVRVSVTASADTPAGTMGVYSHNWYEYQWCSDATEAERKDLVQWHFDHPTMRKGETLEVWLEGVDLTRSWGAVLAKDETSLNADIEAILLEPAVQMERGERPVSALPSSVQGRAGETGFGTGSEVLNDCCSC
jgi:hypothetical protein